MNVASECADDVNPISHLVHIIVVYANDVLLRWIIIVHGLIIVLALVITRYVIEFYIVYTCAIRVYSWLFE